MLAMVAKSFGDQAIASDMVMEAHLRVYARALRLKRCEDIINIMYPQFNLTPSVTALGTFASALARAGKIERAFELAERARSLELAGGKTKPSDDSGSSSSSRDAAALLLPTALDNTYVAIARACARRGRLREGLRAAEAVGMDHPRAGPRQFSSVLRAAAHRSGHVDRVLAAAQREIATGLKRGQLGQAERGSAAARAAVPEPIDPQARSAGFFDPRTLPQDADGNTGKAGGGDKASSSGSSDKASRSGSGDKASSSGSSDGRGAAARAHRPLSMRSGRTAAEWDEDALAVVEHFARWQRRRAALPLRAPITLLTRPPLEERLGGGVGKLKPKDAKLKRAKLKREFLYVEDE
jgi:hypothetical protein